MSTRLRRRAAVAVVTIALVTSCGTTISGSAQPESKPVSTQFAKLLEECIAVPDQAIADTVGADIVNKYFYGAVCMWSGIGSVGQIDITFAWFENNSLPREKTLAERVGYSTEPISVAGSTAFLSRRPGDPASCGITAAYSGVVTWWVQYRGGTGQPDPCTAAAELAKLTLQRNQ